jgi:hypothetical protein
MYRQQRTLGVSSEDRHLNRPGQLPLTVASWLALGLPAFIVAAPFPAVVPLASLLPGSGGDGTEGIVTNGVISEENAGESVNGVGDVNGDGIDDFIVGAPNAQPVGRDGTGAAYVVFGRDTAQAGNFPAFLPLGNLLPANGGDGSAGFVLAGVADNDGFGQTVADAGDVNGDGIDDLVVNASFVDAPGGGDPEGETYVVFGRDTVQAGAFPALFAVEDLLPEGGGDGTEGFAITGIAGGDFSGESVGAGDLNADGVGDLLLSAHQASPNGLHGAGQAYVVFGRDTANAGSFPARLNLADLLPANGGDGSAGFVVNGRREQEALGDSLDVVGDVNGDGIADLAIGASGSNVGARARGAIYVIFGRDTQNDGLFPSVLQLATLFPAGGGDGSAGFVLAGSAAGDRLGSVVSKAGDLNADGIADVVVGADGAGPGAHYVIFGRDTVNAGNFPAVWSAGSLLPPAGGDGSAGFVLSYLGFGDHAGSLAVSAAGDVNADGIEDLLVGAGFADPGGNFDAGSTYVVYGRDTSIVGNFPPHMSLGVLLPGAGGDGTAGFVLTGFAGDGQSGRSLRDAGDVNGDNIADFIIGARAASSTFGQAYLIFGRLP